MWLLYLWRECLPEFYRYSQGCAASWLGEGLWEMQRTRVALLTYLLIYLLAYLLIYSLTYSMEQSPSLEANRFSASQEIPLILRNPNVHYRIHNSLPHLPILCQLDHVQTLHTNSRTSNLILSCHLRLGLPSCLFPSGFPTKTLYTPLLSPIRASVALLS
jgi:hypothetical protein